MDGQSKDGLHYVRAVFQGGIQQDSELDEYAQDLADCKDHVGAFALGRSIWQPPIETL